MMDTTFNLENLKGMVRMDKLFKSNYDDAKKGSL